MWKVIVAVLVLGFVAYRFAGPSGTDAAAPDGLYDGYAEIRLVMRNEQREIEMVAIEERPNASDCNKPDAGARLTALCPQGHGLSCTLKSMQCVREIEPRYRKMLEQQPVSVHYAHLQADGGAAGPKRAVLLGWGMTEQESQALCRAVQAQAARDAKGKVTCI